jgi:hypothetical protein
MAAWHAIENIYDHEGVLGHEIIFATDAELIDASLYSLDEVIFAEGDGMWCRAKWFDPTSLSATGPELYPIALSACLSARSFKKARG